VVLEKISWTDCVKNEKVLCTVKEERNIVHVIKQRMANWIGHILHRNCLLKRATEEKIEERTEATGRRGRRHKQLLDDLKENRGSGKWKEEAVGCTLWNIHFGRGYGPVIRQDRLQNELNSNTSLCSKCNIVHFFHIAIKINWLHLCLLLNLVQLILKSAKGSCHDVIYIILRELFPHMLGALHCG